MTDRFLASPRDRPVPDAAPRAPIVGAALSMLAIAALYWLPLLHRAPNRLLTGVPVHVGDIDGTLPPAIVTLLVLGCGLGFGSRRPAAFAAAICHAGAFVLLAFGIGAVAADLSVGQPSPTRVRLASGALVGGGLIAAVAILAGARIDRRRGRLLVTAGLGMVLLALAAAGGFDHLSLAIEYRARRATLGHATLEHLALAGAALALAAGITVAASLWRPIRGLSELAINGLQVLPAIALLGGLVAGLGVLLRAVPSLRDYGLSALGPGPAVLGIAAYLLLPLWRGLHAGLAAADPATIDAGTALGLTPRQMLVRVRLPLGAPQLIGGLRVAAVQAIGLATLGALVGAGGLGGIVFDGMAQFAPDLILIGALPIVVLSLVAERSLSALQGAVVPGVPP